MSQAECSFCSRPDKSIQVICEGRCLICTRCQQSSVIRKLLVNCIVGPTEASRAMKYNHGIGGSCPICELPMAPNMMTTVIQFKDHIQSQGTHDNTTDFKEFPNILLDYIKIIRQPEEESDDLKDTKKDYRLESGSVGDKIRDKNSNNSMSSGSRESRQRANINNARSNNSVRDVHDDHSELTEPSGAAHKYNVGESENCRRLTLMTDTALSANNYSDSLPCRDLVCEVYSEIWSAYTKNISDSLSLCASSVLVRVCSKKRAPAKVVESRIKGLIDFLRMPSDNCHLSLFSKLLGLYPRAQEKVRPVTSFLVASLLVMLSCERCIRNEELVSGDLQPSAAEFRQRLVKLAPRSVPLRRVITALKILLESHEPHWVLAPLKVGCVEYGTPTPWMSSGLSKLLHLLLQTDEAANGDSPAVAFRCIPALAASLWSTPPAQLLDFDDALAACSVQTIDTALAVNACLVGWEQEMAHITSLIKRSWLTLSLQNSVSAVSYIGVKLHIPERKALVQIHRFYSDQKREIDWEDFRKLAAAKSLPFSVPPSLLTKSVSELQYHLDNVMRTIRQATWRKEVDKWMDDWDWTGQEKQAVEDLLVMGLEKPPPPSTRLAPAAPEIHMIVRDSRSKQLIGDMGQDSSSDEGEEDRLKSEGSASLGTQEEKGEFSGSLEDLDSIEDEVAAPPLLVKIPSDLSLRKMSNMILKANSTSRESAISTGNKVSNSSPLRQASSRSSPAQGNTSRPRKLSNNSAALSMISENDSRNLLRCPPFDGGLVEEVPTLASLIQGDARYLRADLTLGNVGLRFAAPSPLAKKDPAYSPLRQKPFTLSPSHPHIIQALVRAPPSSWESPIPARHQATMVDVLSMNSSSEILERVKILSSTIAPPLKVDTNWPGPDSPAAAGGGGIGVQSTPSPSKLNRYGTTISTVGVGLSRQGSTNTSRRNSGPFEDSNKQMRSPDLHPINSEKSLLRVHSEYYKPLDSQLDPDNDPRVLSRLSMSRTALSTDSMIFRAPTPLGSHHRGTADFSNFVGLRSAELPTLNSRGVDLSNQMEMNGESTVPPRSTATATAAVDCLLLRNSRMTSDVLKDVCSRLLQQNQLKQLLKLDITGNKLGRIGAKILASSLRSHCQLVELSMGENNFMDAGVRDILDAIKTGGGAKKLKKLDLKGNGITLASEDLYNLDEFNHLRILDLSWNSIAMDSKIQKDLLPSVLNSLHHLQVLSLAYNRIGDKGCTTVLTACSSLKNLKLLDLAYCFLTLKSVDPIKKFCKNGKAELIMLHNISLTAQQTADLTTYCSGLSRRLVLEGYYSGIDLMLRFSESEILDSFDELDGEELLDIGRES